MSLEDNARRAREAGLSYGKYMARYGKTPEQVTREAEARKLGDADRVIRRSYAHAEKQGNGKKTGILLPELRGHFFQQKAEEILFPVLLFGVLP